MSNDPKTLYLLQDGTQADPSDVAPDEQGVLRHKNGLAVCMSEDGKPVTIGDVARGNEIAAGTGTEQKGPAAAEEPQAPAEAQPERPYRAE